MQTERVLITGIGCIGSFGAGKSELKDFFDDNGNTVKNISEIDLDQYIGAFPMRRADINSCFAAAAAQIAIEDAGLNMEIRSPGKTGLVMGTTHGPVAYTLEYDHEIAIGNGRMASPLLFSNSLPNTMASYLGNIFKICGSTTTFTGYNSAMQAIKRGSELIKEGTVDTCIVGGVDIYNDLLDEAYSFCIKPARAISNNFGGSGILILESSKQAASRQVKPYAEIIDININTIDYSKTAACNIVTDHMPEKIDRLMTSSWNNTECQAIINAVKDKLDGDIPVSDHSNTAGYTFSAGEIFKVIYAILKTADEKQNRTLLQTFTKLGSVGSLLLKGCKNEI